MYFNPISKIDCVLVPKHTLSSLYKDYLVSPNLLFQKEILRGKIITNQPLCERLNILVQSLNKEFTNAIF